MTQSLKKLSLIAFLAFYPFTSFAGIKAWLEANHIPYLEVGNRIQEGNLILECVEEKDSDENYSMKLNINYLYPNNPSQKIGTIYLESLLNFDRSQSFLRIKWIEISEKFQSKQFGQRTIRILKNQFNDVNYLIATVNPQDANTMAIFEKNLFIEKMPYDGHQAELVFNSTPLPAEQEIDIDTDENIFEMDPIVDTNFIGQPGNTGPHI